MASLRDTPARSRFLTAVLRKSCGTRAPIFLISLPSADLISLPSPAFTQAVSQERRKVLIGLPLRWNNQGMIRPVALSSALVCSNCRSMISRNRTVHGKLRPSLFLVSPGSNLKPAGAFHIRVMFLSREYFVVNAPASDVGRLDCGLQVFGQILQNGIKLLPLKESFSGVVERQLADVRFGPDLPGSHAKDRWLD
jgi:hypothetical protein